MRKTVPPLPNPAIVIDLMSAVVIGTTALAALVLLSTVTAGNWYFDHINAFIAALMALLAAHRLFLGVQPGFARTAWIAILLLFVGLMLVSPFDATMERIETLLGIDDLDDLCFWFVLPCALLIALRSERIGRFPLQLLLGGFLAQTVSTALDLLDDGLKPIGHITVAELVDFSEFVYLQLYFVGLTLTMTCLYLRRWSDGQLSWSAPFDPGFSAVGGYRGITMRAARLFHGRELANFRPRLRWGSTRLGYLVWRTKHWRGGYGEFYSRSIARQLEQGGLHRTLGTHTWDRAGAPAWAALEFEKRGLEILPDLARFGLTPGMVCVDYGCGSLRIGQHLIRMQDPGCYWGLDVSDRFFRPAAAVLPPELLADRRPHLYVIAEDVLARLERQPPDFLFSYAVIKHVPPRELDTFFDRFTRLIGPNTTALLYFPDAPTERIASMSWLHPSERLVEMVMKRCGGVSAGITRVGPNPDPRHRHPRSVLWITGTAVDRSMPTRLN